MGVEERVTALVSPIFEEWGVELIDVEHLGSVLRISADQPDGIDIGTLQDLTREVSRLLDEADPLPGRYTLEVSSPGLERPLRTPAHFTRAVGQRVKVKTRVDIDGERRSDGQLVAAGPTTFDVLLESGVTRTVAYDDVDRAHTVFEWGPGPKPGKGPKKPKPAPALPEPANSDDPDGTVDPDDPDGTGDPDRSDDLSLPDDEENSA